jgi:hypothetical protein
MAVAFAGLKPGAAGVGRVAVDDGVGLVVAGDQVERFGVLERDTGEPIGCGRELVGQVGPYACLPAAAAVKPDRPR